MEQRKARRVVFERGYDANMMAIDGTWCRACVEVEVMRLRIAAPFVACAQLGLGHSTTGGGGPSSDYSADFPKV